MAYDCHRFDLPDDLSSVAPVDEVGERLLAAADVIRKHGFFPERGLRGFLQLVIGSDPRCAMLAIAEATLLDRIELRRAVRERFSSHIGVDSMYVPQWNDERSRVEVLAALEAAARQS